MFCQKCGKEISDDAYMCVHCGVLTHKKEDEKNAKGWVLAIVCFFLGWLGVHRFMVGKVGTGVLWLLTGGCFGIGALIDLILILCSNFTNKEGEKIPLN